MTKAAPAPAPADRQPATVSLDPVVLADLDELAQAWSTTREHLLETAVMRFVDEERPVIADDPEDGPVHPPYRDPSPEGQALDRAEEAACALDAYIKVGEDDLDSGRWVSHEQLVQELRERRANRNAA